MRYLIMAANGFENEFQSWLHKNGFQYCILNGVYKGQSETSFKIKLNIRSVDMLMLLDRAKKYKQESVLCIGHKAVASLLYIQDKKMESIGRFQIVDKDTALSSDAYRHDPVTGSYYLAA